MDDRAYHLQPSAHAAVAVALRNGKLTRRPCEVCGDRAQAHHDSYYPERWLDVRWLCASHHRQWHLANEPEWPTIFEYHPSDEEFRTGRAGRPPKPWYWKARQAWGVNIDGKRYNLGKDEKQAVERFRELCRGRRADVSCRTISDIL